MSKKQKIEMKIRDMATAAFLIVRGHRVQKISREGPIAYWHFEETSKNSVEEAVGDFMSGDATGDCKRFSEAMKTLKQSLRKY